jgi:sortase A
MTRGAIVLEWIERGLIAIGAALALWCAVTILEARYVSRLPIPGTHAARRGVLPGETTGNDTTRRAALPRGTWIARLDAPSVSLSATVLEGSDDRTLGRAAGHIEETALPGQRGNFAVAAHRDTVFRPVRNLRVGDTLIVTTAERLYTYRVRRTQIVAPSAVDVLDPADHPTLTLVTCYPFTFIGRAPERYVVVADLVAEETRMVSANRAGGAGQAGH